MDSKLDRIITKLDKIENHLSSVDITLESQRKDLEHHIFRTDLSEENLEMLRNEFKETIKALKSELRPVKAHVAFMDAALKIIGGIATVATFLGGAYKFFF